MTDSHSPIGVCDSGWGGLSILQALRNELPYESYTYIGDHEYLPYAEKDTAFIQSRVIGLIDRLRRVHKAKLVVVACNTATVAGIDIYRARFPDLPIVGVVPVVKLAASLSQKKSFAVLSTVYTANSQYQRDLIHRFAGDFRVFNIGCPGLVQLVEQGKTAVSDIGNIVREVLPKKIQDQIDVLALGCTHFPFLRPALTTLVRDGIVILDSGEAVARQVRRVLEHEKLSEPQLSPVVILYSTGLFAGRTIVRALFGAPVEVGYEQI